MFKKHWFVEVTWSFQQKGEMIKTRGNYVVKAKNPLAAVEIVKEGKQFNGCFLENVRRI